MSEHDQAPTNPNIDTVIAPERSVGVSEPTPEPGETPEKKKSRKGLAIGLTSGLAGAALAAGAIIGISAATDVPKSQPTAEAPGVPGATGVLESLAAQVQKPARPAPLYGQHNHEVLAELTDAPPSVARELTEAAARVRPNP